MRQTVVILALLLAVVSAGCIGPQVSNAEARDRALDAEESYISNQLENASCVNSWSFQSFGGIPENATVHNTTNNAVYVDVTHPYTYSTDRVNADIGTEARYRVTTDEGERISGTTVSPC